MKTKYLFLSLVFAAFLSSSIPSGSHSLVKGEEAPAITLSSNARISSLDDIKGKYVILNFWSASDPLSRVTNNKIAALAESLPDSKVKMVSICTDTDQELAIQIMTADNIPASVISLGAADVTADVTTDYQTATGNRSFLIDPFGNLVEVSPSIDTIKTLIS